MRPLTKRDKIVSTSVAELDWRPSIASLAEHRIPEAEKDAHLIDTALSCENIILSCDEHARENFRALTSAAPRLGRIHWVNPVEEYDALVNWLQMGLRPDPRFSLREPDS